MKYKKFEDVYSFNAERAALAGVDVKVFDKDTGVVANFADVPFVRAVTMADDNTGRYYFFAGEEFDDTPKPETVAPVTATAA